MNIDLIHAEIERLKKENETLRKGFEDRAQFDKLGDDMAKKMFYPSYSEELTKVKDQRDSFKSIAEESVKIVKEQDDKIQAMEKVVEAARKIIEFDINDCNHGSIDLRECISQYDSALATKDSQAKEDASSIPKPALDRLTKEKPDA